MDVEMMDMSLDDIIEHNTPSRPNTSAGKRSGKTRRRGRKPGDGVKRGLNHGGIARSSSCSMPGRNTRKVIPTGTSATRQHISYSGCTKLIVSNLDFVTVTDADIHELFGEFALKSAGVHYDSSGRSLGLAHLVFETQEDAIDAMKRFNGERLYGREMRIKLATSQIPRINFVRGGSNVRQEGSINRCNDRTSRSSGRAGGKHSDGDKPEKVSPTAEELDAELDEYIRMAVDLDSLGA